MPLPLFHVDAFTDRPFAGNPAAVCLLDGPAPDGWLAAIGAEMNLPETAFCWPQGKTWGLRWFSPTTEVPLCGHATLASAHVLWASGRATPGETLEFLTMSGSLYVNQRGDRLELDLPASPPHDVDSETAAMAVRAAGAGDVKLDATAAGAVTKIVGYERKLLVDLGDEHAVRTAVPDQTLIANLPYEGLLLTAAADQGSDVEYVVRFFAPNLGIAEDPATGSAQCAAGPYWAAKTGRTEFRCFQASPRGGHLRVSVGAERVAVSGRAVTVAEGTLQINP